MSAAGYEITSQRVTSPHFTARKVRRNLGSIWRIEDEAGRPVLDVRTQEAAIARIEVEEARYGQAPAKAAAKPIAAPVPAESASAPAAHAAAEPMATDRQVAYALRLARTNAEGSLELTADQARRMTRRQISQLIDSLGSEW